MKEGKKEGKGFVDWTRLELIELLNSNLKLEKELLKHVEKNIIILTKVKRDI